MDEFPVFLKRKGYFRQTCYISIKFPLKFPYLGTYTYWRLCKNFLGCEESSVWDATR